MANGTVTVTKIKDVIQPELFLQYVIDETAEQAALMYSGAIENNAAIGALVSGGGSVLVMPKWSDLSGNSEVLSDTDALGVSPITAKAEKATVLIRGKAWGANDLAGALAGDDPMRAVSQRVAQWWVRDERDTIISILKGVFASTEGGAETEKGATGLKLDISGDSGAAANISANAVLDAKQKMGDAAGDLSLIYMHSAVFTALQKQNVIQFIPASESQVSLPTYLGYRVVMDDNCPVDSGEAKKYHTYLLSRGCIQRGEGTPVSLVQVETDRDSLASNDILINRRAVVLHPKGMSWKGNPTGATPSNVELATGTNWERVMDIKKIGMVELIHKI